MDGPVVNHQNLGVDIDRSTILRVSHPWPARTKEALRASLDCGTFEDIRVTDPSASDPESTEQRIYFAWAVDKRVGASISRCKPSSRFQSDLMTNDSPLVRQPESASQQEVEASLLTLVTNFHGHFLVPDVS